MFKKSGGNDDTPSKDLDSSKRKYLMKDEEKQGGLKVKKTKEQLEEEDRLKIEKIKQSLKANGMDDDDINKEIAKLEKDLNEENEYGIDDSANQGIGSF